MVVTAPALDGFTPVCRVQGGYRLALASMRRHFQLTTPAAHLTHFVLATVRLFRESRKLIPATPRSGAMTDGLPSPTLLFDQLRTGLALSWLDSRQPVRIDCFDDIHYLAEACALSDGILGRASASEVKKLFEIRCAVVEQLRSAYTLKEILRGACGGWPSEKEIVLYLLLRKYRPSLVVETGVAQGVSTTYILSALARNGSGSLESIDAPNYSSHGPEYFGTARMVDRVRLKAGLQPGWLVPPPLRRLWNLSIGRSRDILPKISRPIGMFYHDSEHSFENMSFEFEWAWQNLVPSGLLVSDDIDWNDAFGEFSRLHSSESSVLCDRTPGVLLRISQGQGPPGAA
jgi:hypothetical protein